MQTTALMTKVTVKDMLPNSFVEKVYRVWWLLLKSAYIFSGVASWLWYRLRDKPAQFSAVLLIRRRDRYRIKWVNSNNTCTVAVPLKAATVQCVLITHFLIVFPSIIPSILTLEVPKCEVLKLFSLCRWTHMCSIFGLTLTLVSTERRKPFVNSKEMWLKCIPLSTLCSHLVHRTPAAGLIPKAAHVRHQLFAPCP